MPARLPVGVLAFALAVERHRQNTRQRRLPRPTRTAEQIAVRDTTAGNRALQRVRDVRLDSDRRERLWAVLAREGEGHADRARDVGDEKRGLSTLGGAGPPTVCARAILQA